MPKCEYCGKPAKMGLQLQSTHHTLIQSKVDKICIHADNHTMIQTIITAALLLIVLFTITSLVAGWPLPGSIGFVGRRW